MKDMIDDPQSMKMKESFIPKFMDSLQQCQTLYLYDIIYASHELDVTSLDDETQLSQFDEKYKFDVVLGKEKKDKLMFINVEDSQNKLYPNILISQSSINDPSQVQILGRAGRSASTQTQAILQFKQDKRNSDYRVRRLSKYSPSYHERNRLTSIDQKIEQQRRGSVISSQKLNSSIPSCNWSTISRKK